MEHTEIVDSLVYQLEAGYAPYEREGRFFWDHESVDDIMVEAARVILGIRNELFEVRDMLAQLVSCTVTQPGLSEEQLEALGKYDKYMPKYL